MLPPKPIPPRKGPEAAIQAALVQKLKGLDWLVKSTHGNAYQSGFPDLYCCHRTYGPRWIEVKNAKSFSFTNAQMEWFPRFDSVGSGIWILTDSTEEEYKKLFRPPNWFTYLSIWRGART